MKYRFPKNVPLIPVNKPIVGQHYHVAWGFSRGIIGVCVEINEINKTVILQTPKTRVRFANPVKWADLRHTRKNQVKNPH